MKKFLIVAVFSFVATFLVAVPVYATNITVFAYGQQVNFIDQQPVIVGGRTLVPMRGVFEHMGFDIDWNATTSVATLTTQGTVMTVRASDNFFTVNGAQVVPEVPPQIMSGRFMLPLRAIAEATGATVDWMPETSTVVIVPPSVAPTSPIGTVPPITPPTGTVPPVTPPIGEVPDTGITPPIGEVPDTGITPPIGEVPDTGITPPIGEVPDMGITPPIGEVPDTGITPPLGEIPPQVSPVPPIGDLDNIITIPVFPPIADLPNPNITPPIGQIPDTSTINIRGTTYNTTFLGEQDLTGTGFPFASRAFFRVENAFDDVSEIPTNGNILPFDNFPVEIQQNQVFAIVYTNADGTTETFFYRTSGLSWNGRDSAEAFVVE